jgi:predicted hydrocarbon binding protein
MTITKHISIDKDCVDNMKLFVEKHNGNVSAAMREIIERAGKSSLPANSSAIDSSLFKWILNEIDGTLVSDTVLDEIIDPRLINSMSKLEDFLNRKFSELGWNIDLILKYNNEEHPSNVLIEIRGSHPKIKFIACILSQYLVKNSLDQAPLNIRSIVDLNDFIKVELSRSNKTEAQKSLIAFFGGMEEVMNTINTRPAFWKALINRHILSNYNMITVHRNYFEDVLAGKIPADEITIENLAKKPIKEIPLKEMLFLIKEAYEFSRVTDRVDIDKDTLVISHNYRTKEAIEKLKKSLIMLLEANGHLYDAKSTASMIVLMHRPDVGIKINEIVENLKTSRSSVDQELFMFMGFLKGLEDIPNIPVSLTTLGRRIGTSLMQEYEKENNINSWNLETFQKALQLIDSRLHRESEWKLDGKNLLYIIRKCNIATGGNTFDTYVCHTARETFKGALNYAFRNKAELEIKKLLSHGDNFCEVIIRIS